MHTKSFGESGVPLEYLQQRRNHEEWFEGTQRLHLMFRLRYETLCFMTSPSTFSHTIFPFWFSTVTSRSISRHRRAANIASIRNSSRPIFRTSNPFMLNENRTRKKRSFYHDTQLGLERDARIDVSLASEASVEVLTQRAFVVDESSFNVY